MRNIIGQPVAGDDLYGHEYELERLWEQLEQGEHRPDARAREVGRHLVFRSNLLRVWWRKHHGPGDNR